MADQEQAPVQEQQQKLNEILEILVDKMQEQSNQKNIQQLASLSQLLNQQTEIQTSLKVKTFFANLIKTKLDSLNQSQLLSLPLLIKKLDLDQIPVGPHALSDSLMQKIETQV